jgi:hypothetical protein
MKDFEVNLIWNKITELSKRNYKELYDEKMSGTSYMTSKSYEELKLIAMEKTLNEIKSTNSDVSYNGLKVIIERKLHEINNMIDPSWHFNNSVYIVIGKRLESKGQSKEMTYYSYGLNKYLDYPLKTLNQTIKLLHLLFPKSKLWVACFGNTIKNTHYFGKGQKVKYQWHGHNWSNERSRWIGFNRRTKKYELHNLYHKYIINIRFKLVGSCSGSVPTLDINPFWAIHNAYKDGNKIYPEELFKI